jgi:glycosyltransferase involved in cell wall biosynthesis
MNGFLVICPTPPGRFDGVADYAAWLAASLSASTPAWLVGLRTAGASAGEGVPEVRRIEITAWRELWRRRREPPFVNGTPLVQYVPQLYAGRLDSLWLLLWLMSVRAGGRRALVTVHEYAVPAAASARRVAARVLLPLVIALVGAVASHVVTTIGLTDRRLRRLLFWKRRRIALVPVGTNIPPRAAEAPRRAPDAAGPIVCTLFGQPAAMSAGAVAAIGEWARAEGGRVRLRWVGRSRDEIVEFCARRCGLPPDLVEVFDRRPAGAVSDLLASSDLFLAPLADGVSTRRTTVVAALAHGLPVVGTYGPSTDALVGESPACALAPVGAPAELVARLRALASDADARTRMGRAARELFEARFTWDAIAAAYRRHLAA